MADDDGMATPTPAPTVDAALAAQPLITDWIGAIAALGTLAVAVFALLYARKQVAEAAAARAQAAALEIERSQPYVVMFTEPSAATPLLIDLVIRNYGQTSATDVSVELDPWPRRSPDDGASATEDVELPDRIPVLAPGQEWRTSWDDARARQRTDLPEQHVGIVSYGGIDGALRQSPVVLDWSLYRSRRWVTIRSIHDGAKALREMSQTMRKWTEGPRGGLATFTRDGDAKDARERERLQAWRLAQDQAREHAAETDPPQD